MIVGVAGMLAISAFWSPALAQVSQENRFLILRTVIADSAASRVVMPLGADGIELSDAGVIDEEKLREELREEGTSIEVGNIVTITDVSFSDDKVEIELNDGGTVKRSIMDRITFSAGGRVSRTEPVDNRPATGSKIVLKFADKVPAELDPDLLKAYLDPVLDFNKQNFMDSGVESLPTEFQEAVRAREVVIGMDQSTVQLSMGRPNRRIRERVDGVEREDWIYYENGIARRFITFEEGVVIRTVKY